jgi:hypothetical protein
MVLLRRGGYIMSTGVSSEEVIERDLREILSRLDRALHRANAALGWTVVLGGLGTFFLQWVARDQSFKTSFASGAGLCVLAAFLGSCVDEAMVWRGRSRFNTRFPPDSPDRTRALAMLDEMESPNKAEVKLRESLLGSDPSRIVRRRTGPAPEQQIDAALAGLAGGQSPASAAVTTQPAAAPVSPAPAPVSSPATSVPGQRPGGYYDYVPLELPRDNPADKKA